MTATDESFELSTRRLTGGPIADALGGPGSPAQGLFHGKITSPQNLAIAANAVGLEGREGREGDIFRKVFGWSIACVLFMCIVVYLQSTSVLSWMVIRWLCLPSRPRSSRRSSRRCRRAAA